jgi:hypothetical protein
MEATTRSPIFAGFGELLDGIVTVRAFAAERRFLDRLHQMVDTNTKVHIETLSFPPSVLTWIIFSDGVFLLDAKSVCDYPLLALVQAF